MVDTTPQCNTKINSNRENEVYNVRQIFIELVSTDWKHDKGSADNNADTYSRPSDTGTAERSNNSRNTILSSMILSEPTSEVNYVLRWR